MPMKLPWMTLPLVYDDEACASVGRDHVAGTGRRSTDDVVRREDRDADVLVAQGERAAGIGADEVALDVISSILVQHDAESRVQAFESVDHQPPNGAPAGADVESIRIPRIGAADLDQERAVEAAGVGVRAGSRLAVAVDDRGIGDGREARRRRDRVDAGARDVEIDRVEPGRRVGVEDRLSERPCSGVVRIGDCEGGGAQSRHGNDPEGRESDSAHETSYCWGNVLTMSGR